MMLLKPTTKYVLFVFLCLCFTGIAAQWDMRAEKYYKIADSLLLKNSYKEAILSFENALVLFKNDGRSEDVVKCHDKLAKSYFGSYQLSEAKAQIDSVLSILNNKRSNTFLEKAIAYDNLGYYYQTKSELSLSLKYYLKTLELYKKKIQNTVRI